MLNVDPCLATGSDVNKGEEDGDVDPYSYKVEWNPF